MTCNDCIHYDLCRSCSRIQLGWNVNNTVTYVENVEETCEHFADRSRFVELPCKVGDPLYTIQQRCTEKGYYSEKRDTFISDCEYCSDGVCDKEFYIKETRFNRLSQIVEYYERYILDSSFEKYRKEFHIKEEAEQALKEREEND